MKAYKMLIKVIENNKPVYKALKPTRGEDYLFPSKEAVYNAYRSLYYLQTFIGFNEAAKIEEVEVPDNANLIMHY